MKKTKTPLLPIVGCLVALLCVGVVYVWSVLKAASLSYFGWEDGSANMIASFMLFSYCLGSFLGGALNVRFAAKKIAIAGVLLFAAGLFLSSCLPSDASVIWFYITYSVIGGIGVGFTYNSGLFCLQKWFPHRRGFASGMGSTAFGLGSLVFGPVISALLKHMTLMATLRTLSVAVLVVGVAACLLIRDPGAEYLAALPKIKTEKLSNITAKKDLRFREAIATLPFWLLTAGLFLYNATWNVMTPLVKGLGMSRGLSDSAAVLCVSLTGVFNASGRMLLSTLSDSLGRIRTFCLLCVVTTVCAVLLIFVGSGAYFAAVLLTVFAFGGFAGIYPSACTDLCGQAYSGVNCGFSMLALGLSSIVFNAVSNAGYSATGNYTISFLICALTAAAAIVVIGAIPRAVRAGKDSGK